MGCSHMGEMISKVVQRLQGKARRRTVKSNMKSSEDHPTMDSGKKGVAKFVISNRENPIIVTQPKHESKIMSSSPPPQHVSVSDTVISPSTHAFAAATSLSETKEHVQFGQVGTAKSYTNEGNFYGGGRNDTYHSRYGSGFAGCSFGSPISGPESGEHRKDYLCGDYHNYPTPVREGIYNLATNGSRLTSIFSDENPNACRIT